MKAAPFVGEQAPCAGGLGLQSRWLGRLRMATAAQVAERFEVGRAVSYARLSELVRLGLLEHARILTERRELAARSTLSEEFPRWALRAL